MGIFSRINAAFKRRLNASAFEGAMQTRRLIAWKATQENINTLLSSGGDILRARARQIVRSNPYASNAADSFVANVVGTGITPSSLITDTALKDELQKVWLAWTDEADADTLVLAQDMSAAFGGDLQSNVSALGRAMEDPINGLGKLQKSYRLLTESQRDTIQTLVETGRQAEAQKMINSKNHRRSRMLNFVQRWMPLAIVMSLLTACATVNSDPTRACPPIRKYDHEFQRKLAAEIEAAPADSVFPVALQDYALLRLQLRECR